ncbi:psbQ-like protein 3, chloroplastic [Humulus lupulus]|uniref:psbQ-like protein 3, chloroplastic n=1 Tax=Humulus lupulus TaxID=3486 RepID=UPI002B404066|nr:psbQ-like protein 3, chloroplastic [Humulus lupulus]
MIMIVKPFSVQRTGIVPLFNCCCCCLKPTSLGLNKASELKGWSKSRRGLVMVAIGSVVFNFDGKWANGLDMGLGMVAPGQTVEEAQNGIRDHILALLQVKDLIDSQSWREAQKALRKSSAFVKLDLYTIIQASPATQRPQLRKLYFDLSNNVSKLDYAARDKDAFRVLQCYDNIVVAINDILSRI